MKFLQLTAMLVLSSFTFAQSAPEGAFSTLHVQAEDPQEYIDYLKENTEAFEAIGVGHHVVEIAKFQPLPGEVVGQCFGAGVFQHAVDLLAEVFAEGAVVGVLEEFLVGHGAPQEVTEAGGE